MAKSAKSKMSPTSKGEKIAVKAALGGIAKESIVERTLVRNSGNKSKKPIIQTSTKETKKSEQFFIPRNAKYIPEQKPILARHNIAGSNHNF